MLSVKLDGLERSVTKAEPRHEETKLSTYRNVYCKTQLM